MIIRVLKVVLKTILFLLLMLVFIVIGLFIGYCIIGDGHFWEVLNRNTWQHIFDFIK
ncbi:DNA-directed RNA polymerase subunit beta [Tuanshanicoccus lijuaniae]|nr:DNA-directed RNA polymerase subunit beta [Aerococcaceae bacterium zg-1292]MBF6625754.1 DNA-directed RNA polymerase subunit beta [Aerococcaceae bacterium zg-BR9]MBF6978673.1 DNA-directed RNA polymerase subunit beta [Aerococcaceae bacterium zg-BR22]MBS4455658.1 DNA-directed RNA polymerase subunit beta [Aerococcaceae bacterium zg-A91]MBS4457277.1 DNA-directed RNA polymerase subunit beta [Aerococcaceae bacterium zg-BR33]